MTKPIGPICNLDCKYCFYLEKEHLYAAGERWKMPEDVLEEYIRQYIGHHAHLPEISFAWQGGEPTLLGVGFFEKAVALQSKYAAGKPVQNALQTNGVLLDDPWCAFLAANKFLVGLSIDGPRELHDQYRMDKQGRGSFEGVLRGLEMLKKHRVDFNTLTVVNRANSQRPLETYRFLKEIGSGFIQFIPLVERSGSSGIKLAEPPVLARDGAKPDEANPPSPVTPWSVDAKQYGTFLCAIFDEWVRHDVGRIFVQLFDVALGNWAGYGSSLCLFAERCGNALAMEHNGDLYSCDHYVYPRYKLGNVMSGSLGEMVASDQQRQFGADKSDTLPDYCRKCAVRFACNGECPKHRFTFTPDGQPGLNYLCPAYKQFFTHIDHPMRVMTELLKIGRAPATIMSILAEEQANHRTPAVGAPGRNQPCPCGSGKKFKQCCGAVAI